MVSKVFWILTIFVNFSAIFGQDEFIDCEYFVSLSNEYTCWLAIYNPNGLDNFTDVTGTHLPEKSDDDVQFISIRMIPITPIFPSIICEKFKNLNTLNIHSAGLQTIDDKAFENCKNITILDIYANNMLNRIDENSFIENLELKKLQIKVTNLSSLPENIFKNQHKLENLWLSVNKFIDLPKNIFKPLKNLRTIALNSNLLTTLNPELLEPLENLEYLNLDDNQFEELPANIFNSFTNLKEIGLNQNKFKVIHSDWFGILPNLQSIYLYTNQIIAIDEKLLDNTGLNELYVLRNVCADKNVHDYSDSKELLRSEFKQCFENYENLFPSKSDD
ncbi:hypothetical protein ACKWTF_001584 [Chironomus riparius]